MSFGEDDPTICFCHCVPRSVLLEAIRAGADTLEKIQDATRASTGCSGCTCDVEDVLREELERQAALKKAG